MKKIITYLAIAFLAIGVFSCSKDDNNSQDGKVEDLKLSVSSPLKLLVGNSTEVTVSGGDGKNYKAVSSDEAVVTATVSDNKLNLTAIKEGEAKITVTSADKSIDLQVNVLPSLDAVGVYNLDGTQIFEVKSQAEKVGVSYGFFENLNPTSGKMIIVDLIDTPSEGVTQAISVKTRGLDNLPSGNVTTQVEKVANNLIQLKSDNYRFVLPVK